MSYIVECDEVPQLIPLVFYTYDPRSLISFFGDSLVDRNKAKSSALMLNAYFCLMCHTKRLYGYANSAKTMIFIMKDVKTYCPKKICETHFFSKEQFSWYVAV